MYPSQYYSLPQRSASFPSATPRPRNHTRSTQAQTTLTNKVMDDGAPDACSSGPDYHYFPNNLSAAAPGMQSCGSRTNIGISQDPILHDFPFCNTIQNDPSRLHDCGMFHCINPPTSSSHPSYVVPTMQSLERSTVGLDTASEGWSGVDGTMYYSPSDSPESAWNAFSSACGGDGDYNPVDQWSSALTQNDNYSYWDPFYATPALA